MKLLGERNWYMPKWAPKRLRPLSTGGAGTGAGQRQIPAH